MEEADVDSSPAATPIGTAAAVGDTDCGTEEARTQMEAGPGMLPRCS
jgi:hypothetical protein